MLGWAVVLLCCLLWVDLFVVIGSCCLRFGGGVGYLGLEVGLWICALLFSYFDLLLAVGVLI